MDISVFDEKDFCKTYRGSQTFVNEDGAEYYKLFLQTLQNDDLLDKIKFANDVLGVPPVQTFVKYYRDTLGMNVFTETLSKSVKQGIGACFGYLYRFIYKENYNTEQCWVMDQQSGIKTASRFVKK